MAGLLLAPLPALGAELNGDWHGTLDTPTGRHLRMLLRFHTEDGVLFARFVSPDQSGVSFPVKARLEADHLSVTLPRDARYDATLAADGKSINGTFTSRVGMPLTLVPGTIDEPFIHQPGPGDVVVTSPTGPLSGTVIHKGPISAVILNGSGDANRDGNSQYFGARSTYRRIAEGLAAQNISTLRFDKRGIGESGGTPEEDITLSVMADDARTVADALRRQVGGKCAWLIGHSEGGLVALLAAQDTPGICGLVLLASPGRRLTAILQEQLDRTLPADQKPKAFALLDKLDAGTPLAELPQGDIPPDLAMLFRPSLQNYWRSQMAADPAALAGKLKLPILILQGDADVQVSLADAQALAKARPDASLKILPGVNHSQRLTRDDTGGPASAPPLAPGLTDTIAAFIKAHS